MVLKNDFKYRAKSFRLHNTINCMDMHRDDEQLQQND